MIKDEQNSLLLQKKKKRVIDSIDEFSQAHKIFLSFFYDAFLMNLV